MKKGGIRRGNSAVAVCLCALFALQAGARRGPEQIREDYKLEKRRMERERREYADSTRAAFEAFRARQDSMFAAFLDREWKSFQAQKALIRDVTPKPVRPPVIDPDIPLPEPEPEPDLPAVPPWPEPRPLQPPTPMPEPPPPPDQPPGEAHELPFYGEVVTLHVESTLATPLASTGETAEWWRRVSVCRYPVLLDELHRAATALALNDWGRYRLIVELSRALHPNDDRSATALAWFLLVQLGYDVRFAHEWERAILLIAFEQTVYGVNRMRVDGSYYYMLSLDGREPGSRQQSYDGDPTLDLRPLNLAIDQPPAFSSAARTRTLSTEMPDGSFATVHARYNPKLAHFYHDYPQTLLEIHCALSASPELERSLYDGLQAAVGGGSLVDRTHALMRFVQMAFVYGRDDAQFGISNYSMFPEEVVHYPESDCEDRTALFTYLVRRMLKLDTVVIVYEGHAAAAVAFPGVSLGNTVQHSGRVYTICDPTYQKSSPGMCPKKYRNKTPKVVRELPAM